MKYNLAQYVFQSATVEALPVAIRATLYRRHQGLACDIAKAKYLTSMLQTWGNLVQLSETHKEPTIFMGIPNFGNLKIVVQGYMFSWKQIQLP